MIAGSAGMICQRMNKDQSLKRWREFSNPGRWEKSLNEFNRENLDDVGPIGGEEQGMKILPEMNAMVDDHDAFVKSLAPSVVVR